MMHDSLLNFRSVFLDTLYSMQSISLETSLYSMTVAVPKATVGGEPNCACGSLRLPQR
jgi:hypothetical protein